MKYIISLLVICITACGDAEEDNGAVSGAIVDGSTLSTEPQMAIAASHSCFIVDIGYLFTYRVVQFKSGYVWASCAILGGVLQSSLSVFYGPGQAGALDASCAVVWDIDNLATAGSWYFSFISTKDVSAVYEDASSVFDGYKVKFNFTSDCVTYSE